MNAATRRKISESLKGRTLSPEVRAHMSEAQRGRTVSEEHRAKIAATLRGRPVSAETRAKRSAAQKGRTRSAEDRAKISGPRKGAEIGYDGAHRRARLLLPGVCQAADGSCRGRLDAAFRHDAPPEFVRFNDKGHPFYVGPDPVAGYWRLCRSHHDRYDKH